MIDRIPGSLHAPAMYMEPDALPTAIDPFVLLFLALLLDAVLGDMPWLFRTVPHPVALLGGLIGFLDRRLNRSERGERARLVRGVVVTLAVTGLAATVGWGCARLAAGLRYGWAPELLLLVLLLAQRSLYGHVLAVARGLSRDGLAGGRAAVRHIVGRDPKTLDEHGVARAAVESLAENFSDGVVAPVFWYLLLGLPGLFAYKAINTLDSMIGHRSERYRSFGMAAARLDDAANWIPARIAALLLALAAAFVPTANPVRALRVMWRHAPRHASPNAGWPEAAMAGALALRLGGPRRYPGGVSETVWIGEGESRVTVRDIDRALMVFGLACVLQALAVAAVATGRLTG